MRVNFVFLHVPCSSGDFMYGGVYEFMKTRHEKSYGDALQVTRAGMLPIDLRGPTALTAWPVLSAMRLTNWTTQHAARSAACSMPALNHCSAAVWQL